ncbi:MAG: hypothetical protein ACI30R_09405 [Sodaliphilus sp.]
MFHVFQVFQVFLLNKKSLTKREARLTERACERLTKCEARLTFKLVFQVFQVFHVFLHAAGHRRWRIVVNSMQAEAQPERSLENAEAKAMSLEEGRLWQVITKVFQVF